MCTVPDSSVANLIQHGFLLVDHRSALGTPVSGMAVIPLQPFGCVRDLQSCDLKHTAQFLMLLSCHQHRTSFWPLPLSSVYNTEVNLLARVMGRPVRPPQLLPNHSQLLLCKLPFVMQQPPYQSLPKLPASAQGQDSPWAQTILQNFRIRLRLNSAETHPCSQLTCPELLFLLSLRHTLN